jgi:hypothetical protein
MNLHVKDSFVAVEGGPVTLPSWDFVNHDLGFLAEHSRHQSKDRYRYRAHRALEMWNPTHDDTTSEQNFT